MLESGLWTAFLTRTFSKVPHPETIPHSIFIPAIDTNPLSPAIGRILEGQEREFANGLKLISKLTMRLVKRTPVNIAENPANPAVSIIPHKAIRPVNASAISSNEFLSIVSP